MSEKPPISTHILDTSIGRPASNVSVRLHRSTNDTWTQISESKTNADGRCADLIDKSTYETGLYKLTFQVEEYFQRTGTDSLFKMIEVSFKCNASETYHIPLLLTPYSYTTYRGS